MIREELNLALPPHFVSYRMNFDLDRPHDRHVWVHCKAGGGYEPEVCYLILRALRPRDTAIDVGANFGFFSLLMSRLVGSGGKVVALEPAPEANAALLGNIALNPGADNIEVLAAVATEHTGKAEFFTNLDDAAGSCLWDPGVFPGNVKSAQSRQSFWYPSTSLDDLKLKNVRLIKIDAEGAEHAVLLGAQTLLEKLAPPFIVVELNPFGMQQMRTSTEDFRSFMELNGYSLFLLHPDGRLPSLVPTRTEVVYDQNVIVKNALFSSITAVAEAWPEAGR